LLMKTLSSVKGNRLTFSLQFWIMNREKRLQFNKLTWQRVWEIKLKDTWWKRIIGWKCASEISGWSPFYRLCCE
jgi:hypothetical protein